VRDHIQFYKDSGSRTKSKHKMAAFFENLWNSIFTPGATPTLLIATNVSFGALQLVFALLLWATYSIHFVVLSFLCGGLWWGVNWFAAELRKAEKAEQEASRLRRQRTGLSESQLSGGDEADVDDVDDESETETEEGVDIRGGPGKAYGVMESAGTATGRDTEDHPKIRVRGGPSKIQGVMKSAAAARAARGEEALPTKSGAESLSSSRASLGASKEETGSVSTDSEWEKVSDDR
jgi:hypothetical protein